MRPTFALFTMFFASMIAACTTTEPNAAAKVCSVDSDCQQAGLNSRCVDDPSGSGKYCVHLDSNCNSGLRWDSSASAGLAGQCYGQTSGGGGNGQDAAFSSVDATVPATADAAVDGSKGDFSTPPFQVPDMAPIQPDLAPHPVCTCWLNGTASVGEYCATSVKTHMSSANCTVPVYTGHEGDVLRCTGSNAWTVNQACGSSGCYVAPNNSPDGCNCGTHGKTCCPGNSCTDGTVCTSGTCQPPPCNCQYGCNSSGGCNPPPNLCIGKPAVAPCSNNNSHACNCNPSTGNYDGGDRGPICYSRSDSNYTPLYPGNRWYFVNDLSCEVGLGGTQTPYACQSDGSWAGTTTCIPFSQHCYENNQGNNNLQSGGAHCG